MSRRTLWALLFLALVVQPALGQKQSGIKLLTRNLKTFAARFRVPKREKPPEAVQMFLALARGRGMGPGSGWYHPGQSRFTWLDLVEKYDQDADFRLSSNEFPLNTPSLRRLDRDRNGVLTRVDFDWSATSQLNRQLQLPRMWFFRTDNDSNGKITRDEWNKLFNELADNKKFLTPEDLLGLMRRPNRPNVRRTPERPPSPVTIVTGLLNGELGALTEGPKINQMAPDFKLTMQKGNKQIQLSSFKNKKPVVLIFGSFT